MKNKKIIIVALTIVLVAFALQMSLFSAVEAGVAPIDAAIVRGTVTDTSNGLPLAGATVKISPTTPSGDTVTTPSEAPYIGQYIFAEYSEGATLTASKTGYKTETFTVSTADAGVTVTHNFALQPLCTITLTPATATAYLGTTHDITATVKDYMNNPVPGAGVLFTITSGPNAGTQQHVAAYTNGQATFTYAGISGIPDTDTVLAHIGTLPDGAPFSATATVKWIPQLPVPESPFGTMIALLAALGAASFLGLLRIRKRLP
jgi:hypothetical protein